MKKITLLSIFISGFIFSQTQQDSVQFRIISNEILNNGEAYQNLHQLTKQIGHRLSGSQAYEKAVDWAVEKLKEAGADKVWKQEVTVPVWERGKESLQIKTKNGTWTPIKMLSLGNSEGTAGKDLLGEIVVVKNIEEFNQLPDEKVKDKIILFNYPFRQDFIFTMYGYGDAIKYRVATASMVAKRGGKAVLIRSLSTAFDDVPHTGTMRYEKDTPKIPAIALSPKSADELERLSKNSVITVKINSHCGMKGEKKTFSVIGEITGKKSQKVMVVGGHLDTWDVGEGAQDDGAGIVQAIEVLRTFKKLNLQNNNTLRVVCFANEENGAKGAEKYAEEVKSKNEKHIFAIESDAGGYSPRGFGLEMPNDLKKQITSKAELFLPYGIYDFNIEESGVDVGPLRKLGVPLAGLLPDSQRYFDLHHSDSDVFEAVNRRELLLGAVVMAQILYLVDQMW